MTKLILMSCMILNSLGCSYVSTGIDDSINDSTNDSIDKYRIIDWNRIEHLYKENLKEFNYSVHPTSGNNKLIQYCGIHYEWEVIHAKWGLRDSLKVNEDDEFGWSYRVIKK